MFFFLSISGCERSAEFQWRADRTVPSPLWQQKPDRSVLITNVNGNILLLNKMLEVSAVLRATPIVTPRGAP